MIVQLGNPVLRKKASPVLKKEIGKAPLNGIIARMHTALAAEERGVAIAAPQIAVSKQIFLVAGRVFDDNEHGHYKVFINPELMRLSRKKIDMSEGCLSVPGKYGTVVRHEKASVRAWDEQGKAFAYHGTGLLAQIFQHETDHLEGILYIDKVKHFDDDEDVPKDIA